MSSNRTSPSDFMGENRKRIQEILIELGVSEEIALMAAVEWDNRTVAECGGCDVYIRKIPLEKKERMHNALEEVKRTGRPAEAASNNGINRMAIYRMLKRK